MERSLVILNLSLSELHHPYPVGECSSTASSPVDATSGTPNPHAFLVRYARVYVTRRASRVRACRKRWRWSKPRYCGSWSKGGRPTGSATDGGHDRHDGQNPRRVEKTRP